MEKYLWVCGYSCLMKARIAIYNLHDKENLWWVDLKITKYVKEKMFKWKIFKELFKQKYLSQRYYDGKVKKNYELKLGQKTMIIQGLTILNLWKKLFVKNDYVMNIVKTKQKFQGTGMIRKEVNLIKERKVQNLIILEIHLQMLSTVILTEINFNPMFQYQIKIRLEILLRKLKILVEITNRMLGL